MQYAVPILNRRHVHSIPAASVVYVGRPSPWGNPFYLADTAGDAERLEVCRRFQAYALHRIAHDPMWLAPLRGKALMCHCHPARCHAEVLAVLANWPAGKPMPRPQGDAPAEVRAALAAARPWSIPQLEAEFERLKVQAAAVDHTRDQLQRVGSKLNAARAAAEAAAR